MSQAEELLNSATDGSSDLGDSALGYMLLNSGETAVSTIEEHIVIDSERFITVPESLRRIAVQYDHDIETVTFDCPRYWDGHDLSGMKIYINYMRPDNIVGCYLTSGATIDNSDSTIMHFDWVISQNVTLAKGTLSFLVCAKTVDDSGNEANHWNSELNQELYISEGLECSDTITNLNPDVIASLLARTDYVESLTKPEVLAGYINYYLNNSSDMVEAVISDRVSTDAIRSYVYEYIDNNDIVLTDPTLTKSDVAAEAAATGNAIQDLNERATLSENEIDSLRNRVSDLESELSSLRSRVSALEKA